MANNDKKDWVDIVADVAAAFGFNRVRVRWKLDGMRRGMKESAVQTKGKVAHVGYQNKVCPHCHSVNDRDARVCARCGRPLSARPFQILGRIGILSPKWASVSTLLGIAMVVIYARMMIYSGGGWESVLTMDTATLFRFGASFAGAYHDGEWWRLVTAVFLHAGLWHLGFNLFALSQLGPFVEETFGRARMILFFVFTGIVASLGSLALRGALAWMSGGISDASVSIGASGAIMGLMGVMAGWGQREGTSIGRGARNLALKWAVYTLVFGWLIGADNGAHGAGFIAGGLIGLAVRPARRDAGTASPVIVLGAALAALIAAGAIVACLLPLPSPLAGTFDKVVARERDESQVFNPAAEMCREESLGHKGEARRLLLVRWSPNIFVTKEQIEALPGLICAGRDTEEPMHD
jgi:membrane associated rhomboid family serine protease